MANPKKAVPENVPGDFFVDDTCIDCDACRQIAPANFDETANYSFVRAQPKTPAQLRTSLHALVSCPTGSIGQRERTDPGPQDVYSDFPLPVDGPVFYCGFNSPKSYGGNSYLLRHPAGNWLIDSPKFIRPLVQRLEEIGGISKIFLTHADDVADADRFATHFSAQRIIHEHELSAQPGAELVLRGEELVELGPDLTAIPTPGHTAGHCCLLAGPYLFTGDHLAFDRTREQLTAFRDHCWFSWTRQIASMRRLLQHEFQWVLPGHGQRVRLDGPEMHRQLQQLLAEMKS